MTGDETGGGSNNREEEYVGAGREARIADNLAVLAELDGLRSRGKDCVLESDNEVDDRVSLGDLE
jgi:hypothetical protein